MKKSDLAAYLESLGVKETSLKVEKLWRFTDEIMLFNPSLKLVGAKDRDEIMLRHVADSASGYPVFLSETGRGERIADLGSGAGFPGIVLAVLLEDRSFFLIERMRRRSLFLKSVSAILGLGNVTVVESDLSLVSEKYDVLTSRAFHPTQDIASEAQPLSGRALFYKGTARNVENEVEKLREKGYSFEARTVPLEVPFNAEERNMLILRNWRRT